MGVDFIRGKGQAHRKAWRDSATLPTLDLFVQQNNGARRTLRAACSKGERLRAGQRLLLRRVPEGIVACDGTRGVATLLNPPTRLLDSLETRCGVACATVDAVHADAELVDLHVEE